MNHCQKPGHENYNHSIAATIMSEVIKTLMEEKDDNGDYKYGGKNELILYSMHEAVNSSIAADLWSNGRCQQSPDEESIEALSASVEADQYI